MNFPKDSSFLGNTLYLAMVSSTIFSLASLTVELFLKIVFKSHPKDINSKPDQTFHMGSNLNTDEVEPFNFTVLKSKKKYFYP